MGKAPPGIGRDTDLPQVPSASPHLLHQRPTGGDPSPGHPQAVPRPSPGRRGCGHVHVCVQSQGAPRGAGPWQPLCSPQLVQASVPHASERDVRTSKTSHGRCQGKTATRLAAKRQEGTNKGTLPFPRPHPEPSACGSPPPMDPLHTQACATLASVTHHAQVDPPWTPRQL